ncbi:hypothetical protein BASA81_011503 [Batrachochytrium salamandrivorans]|nr:hypothetical protein BASA81_011503 [Batrachochytrium salamandrivorans]
METLRTCGDSASLQKYVTRQLLDTSGFFKDPSFDQSRAHGTRYLMLARMDALWTARKAIQIGILVDTHPFSVDHCILCDQQLLSTSIAHLVVECEQVTGHRIQSGLVPAIQKSRLRLLGRALDPGVENVYTWLRGGVLNGEADLDQRWLDGTVEHESMGTRHDNRALAARLADFLQSADTSTPTSASTTTTTTTVPGFDVIQHPATGPGRRGIALGIPSCFGGHEHGSAVGTMILAKVPNFTPECLWIVGSVYVGHSGATTNYSRREAFASIRQALDRVVPFDNNHPVLIFGDWNTDPQRLQRIVHSWGHGLTVMQFSGSQITRLSTVHGRRHSSIDHFVCNAPARALLTSPRVDRQTAVADHFVIRTSIQAEAQGQPPVPRAPIISRHHCLEATDRIATSNYWDVLADGATDNTDTDTDIHQLTCQFLESANAVADNLSLRLSPPVTRSNRRLLSGTTKRAILASNTARQAFIAAATHTNPDPVQCNTLRDEWSRLKAAATQLERVDGRKQWVKHADNLDRAVSDGRIDLVFSAARAMSGNSSRSAAVTPLYNYNGIVQYDPTSILRVMQGHYGSLAADTTGHSLDLQYWYDRQPIQVSCDTPPIRNSDILDQDFSWNQIAAALLQMSPRKAPGDDGISTAFYQAALYMPANTQEGVPPTPFARALLRVCGQVFASETIPHAWLCASIVSIDKKDGDPLNPGDKRGIALINVGLKLVCKVLQMRIERFVETNNLLSYEQAGFRKREECVGQVVLTCRHHSAQTECWAKHPCSIHRYPKGIRYSPSWCTVMEVAEHGIPSSYSCLSQGIVHILICSSSSRITTIGPISVPGLSRDTNPIQGLMYADDVAVFADSEQSLLAASTAIEQWANRWEIRVESYKYLGVLIDSKLDHSAGLKQKRSALEHTISALHPVLANHQLTVNYRSRIFSAVVMGKAYYGLELVGGNKSHLAPLQTTINKGIRLFTGARLSTAIGPLLVETGIGSLLTRSLVSRVRLLERSVTKRTPINVICSGTDNDVFYTECPRAVGKIPALVLVSSDQTAIQEQILADTTSQTKDSQATTLVCIDGDSTNMWRLCIAPKVCHSAIIGYFWILQGSQFRSITSTWHKISDACAHGCSLDSKKSHLDWHTSRHPPILS